MTLAERMRRYPVGAELEVLMAGRWLRAVCLGHTPLYVRVRFTEDGPLGVRHGRLRKGTRQLVKPDAVRAYHAPEGLRGAHARVLIVDEPFTPSLESSARIAGLENARGGVLFVGGLPREDGLADEQSDASVAVDVLEAASVAVEVADAVGGLVSDAVDAFTGGGGDFGGGGSNGEW